jgi:predicted enzyme related to lactoylglutathione lyase
MAEDSTTITGIDFFDYPTRDAARAIAFYRDILGMTPSMTDEQGRGAEFTLPDGSTFGVWNYDEGVKTSGGMAMFAVGDIDAAVALFRERGAVLSDPVETEVCFMSFGEDPDGNGIIIHHRKVID